jgi:hypothetical protein
MFVGGPGEVSESERNETPIHGSGEAVEADVGDEVRRRGERLSSEHLFTSTFTRLHYISMMLYPLSLYLIHKFV